MGCSHSSDEEDGTRARRKLVMGRKKAAGRKEERQ
jgi:hypothetical protein